MKILIGFIFIFEFNISYAQNIAYSSELGFDNIYISKNPAVYGDKSSSLNPFYFKFSFDQYKILKSGNKIGIKYGVAPTVLVQPLIFNFFAYIFKFDRISPFVVKHDLSFSLDHNGKKIELGYYGIAADRQLFSSDQAYHHGFFVGSKIRFKNRNIAFKYFTKNGVPIHPFINIRANILLVNFNESATGITTKNRILPGISISFGREHEAI